MIARIKTSKIVAEAGADLPPGSVARDAINIGETFELRPLATPVEIQRHRALAGVRADMSKMENRASGGTLGAVNSEIIAGRDDGIPTTPVAAPQSVAPNIADISAHLSALFAPGFVHAYPDAWIEIAYGHPDIRDGAVNQAQNFSAFDLKRAAEFAEAKNRAGFNVYTSPAVRHGKQPGDGRANEHNVLTSAYAWAEFDGAGDDARIDAILKAQNLSPALIVTTGTVPECRAHLYFKVDGNPDVATLRAINTSLMKLLETDTVQNPDRVMRLAGTVNYPTAKKRDERGYVAELVTLSIKTSQIYNSNDLIALTGGNSDHFLNHANSVGNPGRSDDELIDLLKQSRATPGKGWRVPMVLGFIASTVGKGWSDTQIKLAVAPYSDGGVDDPEIQKEIDYARKKFAKPDPKENSTDGNSDLTRLNKRHAILPIGGKTRVVTFGELEEFPGRETVVMTQTISDFVSLQNKYRHEFKDETGKPKVIPMGTYWIESRHRRQYDGGMAFMPQHDKDQVGNKMNLWRGYGVTAIKPEGKSGAAGCDKFLAFMRDVICGGNEEHFDYLRKREATILQKRVRSEVAVGLHTDNEGVGKGFYERVMGHLLGVHAMQVGNPKHVIGAFNPHLETLLRLTADEALFVGNPEHRNSLFGLITESKLTIEPKGCGVYRADSFLNLSITSNAKHFLPISGTARRFFIPTISLEHTQDHAFFKAIQNQLDDGGYQALLFHFLHEVDLTEFNIRVVPKTEGLLEQRNYSLSPLDAWWLELLESGTIAGAEPYAPHRATSNEYQREIEYQTIYGTQSRYVRQLGIYDQARLIEPRLKHHFSDHRLGSHLREMGCENETKVLRRRGWTFPELSKCRADWEKRFPDWPWRDPEITEWRAEEQDDPEQEPAKPIPTKF